MKKLLIFLIGGCIGATASYFYCQNKFNEMLNKELGKRNAVPEPVVDADISEKEDPEVQEDDVKKSIADIHEKPDIFDYSKIAMANKEAIKIEPEDEFTVKEEGHMQLISDDKYQDLSYEYQEQDLIYYEDGIITDVQDNIIFHGLDEMVSGMTVDDFDENGFAHVSDPENQHIYEITRDMRRFDDVFGDEED